MITTALRAARVPAARVWVDPVAVVVVVTAAVDDVVVGVDHEPSQPLAVVSQRVMAVEAARENPESDKRKVCADSPKFITVT